jgi:hypothetical protein
MVDPGSDFPSLRRMPGSQLRVHSLQVSLGINAYLLRTIYSANMLYESIRRRPGIAQSLDKEPGKIRE